MPTGPKGEKRPADVIGNAVKVMKILTGEEPDDYGPEPGKSKAAQELGRAGGRKRAESGPPKWAGRGTILLGDISRQKILRSYGSECASRRFK